MKISVIIPTYKPQDYIWECLDSLYCQTLDKSKFEIILILNGCNEPWRGKIEIWIASHTDLNINFVQTDAPGVSNARNIGLRQAKGEYITFIDDDDYVSLTYLKELLDCSSENCVGLSNGVSFDDKTKKLNTNCSYSKAFGRLKSIENPSLFQVRVFFNGPVFKLIHRDIIGHRRFDSRFANGEDNLMMFLISDRIKHVKFTSDSAIYFRRIRENSATTRKRPIIRRLVNIIKLMIQYFIYQINRPLSYNLAFSISRYVAEIKSLFV